MRQVIASAFVSLDGVMQAPGGPTEDTSDGFRFGGWVAPCFDETVGAAVDEVLTEPYALLLGRKTYDIFAAYWPHHEDGDNSQIAKAFNAAIKYVATSSRAPLGWANSIAIHDAAADVARLKQTDGPNLLVQGSTVLLQTLFAHRLIDRLTVLTFPVILGGGKRLFEGGAKPEQWKLVNAKTSLTGVNIATYTPAGAVQTGSFE